MAEKDETDFWPESLNRHIVDIDRRSKGIDTALLLPSDKELVDAFLDLSVKACETKRAWWHAAQAHAPQWNGGEFPVPHAVPFGDKTEALRTVAYRTERMLHEVIEKLIPRCVEVGEENGTWFKDPGTLTKPAWKEEENGAGRGIRLSVSVG